MEVSDAFVQEDIHLIIVVRFASIETNVVEKHQENKTDVVAMLFVRTAQALTGEIEDLTFSDRRSKFVILLVLPSFIRYDVIFSLGASVQRGSY